jgi:hypothetical protein
MRSATKTPELMKPQTISKAALERAVLAACKVTSANPPPKWFREHTKAKVVAALGTLGISTKAVAFETRRRRPNDPNYDDCEGGQANP